MLVSVLSFQIKSMFNFHHHHANFSCHAGEW
jgi:hypothetical protein